MKVQCPSCGNSYQSLGIHLSKSKCEYPDFTDTQRQIIEGMMLGDGWVNHHNDTGNPFFAVGMANYEFLGWLNEKLQPHTTGVKDATGSKRSTKPYYKIRTMRNPKLDDYADWYSSGSLKLEHIKLTPLALKMWYVSDGWLDYKDDRERPIMWIANRIANDRENYFQELFRRVGVSPNIFKDRIHLNADATEKLFKYMGPAPTGFESKWPNTRDKNDDQQETL